MRIAYVLPHGWRFAGWSPSDVLHRYHFSRHIASSMAALGHEVTLFLLHESVRNEAAVQEDPFRITFYPVTFAIPFARFGADFSVPLFRGIREVGADAVHVHGCFYESLPWLIRAARAPVILQWHGGRLDRFHRTTLRRSFTKTKRIIIPFPAIRGIFGGAGLESQKFDVVPLPLRPEAQAIEPKARYTRRIPRLVCVGRIPRGRRDLSDRRLDVLLKILGRLRDAQWSLDVVGDGPGRSFCEHLAKHQGIDRAVKFHGYLGLSQVLHLSRDSDLSIVPFALPDLTGTWVAQCQESLSVGTPVVAFSSNGAFSEHSLGWRISADPVLGAEHLKSILSQPEVLEEKGKAGPPLVRELCNEGRVSRQLEAIYRIVVAEEPSPASLHP